MPPERFLITAADGDRIDDLVTRLESAGVSVEKVLRAVGVVVGTCEADRAGTLSALEGVAGVEPDPEVRRDPPDGPQ